jgi:hypothetical protein
MKTYPCSSLKTRFVCQYNLNPCLNNNACGSNGQCVSLYHSYYCDCKAKSIFYTGRFCEKCKNLHHKKYFNL